MNAQTQSLTLSGPAGAIEALLDVPAPDLFQVPLGTWRTHTRSLAAP